MSRGPLFWTSFLALFLDFLKIIVSEGNALRARADTVDLVFDMKTDILVPYLRGGVVKLFLHRTFLSNSQAIKSCAIQSIDLELSKKSNESF